MNNQPPYIPTPEEITAECAEIRKGWPQCRWVRSQGSTPKAPGVRAYEGKLVSGEVVFEPVAAGK